MSTVFFLQEIISFPGCGGGKVVYALLLQAFGCELLHWPAHHLMLSLLCLYFPLQSPLQIHRNLLTPYTCSSYLQQCTVYYFIIILKDNYCIDLRTLRFSVRSDSILLILFSISTSDYRYHY